MTICYFLMNTSKLVEITSERARSGRIHSVIDRYAIWKKQNKTLNWIYTHYKCLIFTRGMKTLDN